MYIYRTDYAGGGYDYAEDDPDRVLYFVVDRYDTVKSGYTVKINYNKSWIKSDGDWHTEVMDDPVNTYNGCAIYSYSAPTLTAVDALQYQIYNGSSHEKTDNAITEFKYLSDSTYSGKMYKDGTGWISYATDQKTTNAQYMHWSWTGGWNIDPYIKYCTNDGVWSDYCHMTGSKDVSSGTAKYLIPQNVTAIRLFHGDYSTEGYGRTAITALTSGGRGTYNKATTTGISSESFPTISFSYEYDGGFTPGEGIYITPCSDWTSYIHDDTGIFVYFFTSTTNKWSKKLTAVPGETNLYETEVPTGADVWTGVVVVLHNSAAWDRP